MVVVQDDTEWAGFGNAKVVTGGADFHVRHGAGVLQFIEVAQKFAGVVSTNLSTNCSDSAVTVYWQITLQSGTCRIVCRTFLANLIGMEADQALGARAWSVS